MTDIKDAFAAGRSDLSRVRVGSAPDSWGVWFPGDSRQIPWHRFLDEIKQAGYEWLELGPFGYLPTEPEQLLAELGERGLKLSGAAVYGALHRPGDFAAIRDEARRIAALVSTVGGRYLVFLPAFYRDVMTAEWVEPRELDADAWRQLVRASGELGRIVAEEYGVRLVFHPHADTHVETQEQTERYLRDTAPEHVGLCLDTGHLAYRRADSVAIIRRFPSRVGYIHFKQVDPAVLAEVEKEDLAFAPAVRRGVMCEPPRGIPSLESLAGAMDELDADIFVIIEQDLYPCDPDVPLPIATRTRDYLRRYGLGAP
ncbi:TIM barrel protein [Actinoallomurus acanthiterrae]